MLGSQDSSHAGIPGSFPCRDLVGAAHGKGSAPRSFKTTKNPWNSHPERDFCSLRLGKAGFAGKGPRSRGRIFLGVLPQGWIPRDGSRGTPPERSLGSARRTIPGFDGICPEHRERHRIPLVFPGDPHSHSIRVAAIPGAPGAAPSRPCPAFSAFPAFPAAFHVLSFPIIYAPTG